MRNQTASGFTSPTTEKSTWVRRNPIGKGSFGTVSLAINKTNNRVFAVKSVDMNSSPIQLEALENEISVLRSLSSPYIVEYYNDDVTIEGSTVYRNLHLEYLQGSDCSKLATIIDEQSLKHYTCCLVSALQFLHSNNIVHCDVKAKNVLLGPTPGLAKLVDFGSSRRVPKDQKTKTKITPRGSPLWMAPEVIQCESQGPESDVWSLGCTMIEMITGQPAWDDEGPGTLRRIGYSDETPKVPAQMSKLGRDFVEKCLRRVPGERWSCDQLLRHPFLSSIGPIKIVHDEATPRSVLDFFDHAISDDEDEETEQKEHYLSDSGECGVSPAAAEERIGELATTSTGGENWESDDNWVEVRKFRQVETMCDSATAGAGEVEFAASAVALEVKDEVELLSLIFLRLSLLVSLVMIPCSKILKRNCDNKDIRFLVQYILDNVVVILRMCQVVQGVGNMHSFILSSHWDRQNKITVTVNVVFKSIRSDSCYLWV